MSPPPPPVFDSRIYSRASGTTNPNAAENSSAQFVSSSKISGIKIVKKETKEVVHKDVFEILKKDSNLVESGTLAKDVQNETTKILCSESKNKVSCETEMPSISSSKMSTTARNGCSAEQSTTTAVKKPPGDAESEIPTEVSVSKADVSTGDLFDIHAGTYINIPPIFPILCQLDASFKSKC